MSHYECANDLDLDLDLARKDLDQDQSMRDKNVKTQVDKLKFRFYPW
jgi:hypothetical protein